jgi:hypothetical protein
MNLAFADFAFADLLVRLEPVPLLCLQQFVAANLPASTNRVSRRTLSHPTSAKCVLMEHD